MLMKADNHILHLPKETNMERIRERRSSGINGNTLRMWGLLFVVLGAVGHGILQLRILGMGALEGTSLMAVLESDPDMMMVATMAIVLQALETCAVPIFAFLLVEGMLHTTNVNQYLIRILGTAALAELPYNLVMSGKLLDFSSRNPTFGLVIGLIAMWLYARYPGNEIKMLAIKGAVTLCAAIWCNMLSIRYGVMTCFLAAVLWAFRSKPNYRNMAGAAATILCSLNNLFFMAAPMGFLAVFLYNGEQGDANRKVNYLVYPAILLAVAVVGMFL